MAQDLFYLISGDTMLLQQLVNDVSQPNDSGYVHQQGLTQLSCFVLFLYLMEWTGILKHVFLGVYRWSTCVMHAMSDLS
jgi:hypothetical protein